MVFFIDYFLYIYTMKKFMLGLILILTFSFVGNSFGCAIPNDAKIEKTFKQDVSDTLCVVIPSEIEFTKIAVFGSLKPMYIFSDLFNEINSAEKGFINKNKKDYKTPYLNTRHNLPLKVGWMNVNKNV